MTIKLKPSYMEWTPNKLAYDLNNWLGNRDQLFAAANMLRQQEQKIAELEKDLFMTQKHYDQLGVRKLTDEEIEEVWYKEIGPSESLIDFARAILKKASEK